MNERDIQRSITDFLTNSGIMWWRVYLGGVKRSGKGRTKNPMAGFPDLCGLTQSGRFFAIEVKKPKTGRVSDDQAKWRQRLTASGALYCEARSLQDVTNFLLDEGWE